MNPLDFAPGILAPAVVAGAILLVAWGLASRAARRSSDAPGSAAALAASLGALAGFCVVFGWRAKPAETWQWIEWVFPAAAVLGLLESRPGASELARWAARVLLVGAATALVFRHRLAHPAGGPEWGKAALYFGAPLAVIALWRAILPQLGAVVGASALWMTATGCALLFLFGGSLTLSQVAGSVAGALGALIVACLLRPSPAGMAGAVLPAVVILSTTTFLSFEFSYPDYSRWLFAVLAGAPLCGFVGGERTWLRLLAIAAPIGVAVVLAWLSYAPDGY